MNFFQNVLWWPQFSQLSPKERQSGQVGIVIILLMVVLLTYGLSLAARTSKEIILSQQQEESNRVFNAAEAGVEKAIAYGVNFTGDTYSSGPFTDAEAKATVNYTITKKRVLDTQLLEGSTAHVQLVETGLPTLSSITINWSKETDCTTQDPASLIISVFTVDTSVSPPVTTVRHFATAACDHGDGTTVAGGSSVAGLFKSFTLPLKPTDTFLRIKPVYNDTQLYVNNTSGQQLPVQGYSIRSEAKNQNGNEVRAVQVDRSLAAAPSVLDFVLFGGTTIGK